MQAEGPNRVHVRMGTCRHDLIVVAQLIAGLDLEGLDVESTASSHVH